ncbi:MAG: hypothetical protein HY725_07790 [Candidatus Rokubacteria bacterium]|nr:hypothetical protein [Candidatus Rokubacteria bacterium]
MPWTHSTRIFRCPYHQRKNGGATQAARRPGPLRAWFRAVERRKGKRVTRVGLTRRLAESVYHLWKDEIDYFEVLRPGGVRG